ncbi:PLDc N-terminal domain-containing protein [Nocardioides donggukensis]|uniref:PLDc N-terminal domain-containing protein n=1 Tax=Nocardioides donggukensis TaxID=2774019 RepID=A0A927K2Y4_9ACTN|nr:PLDc N-terminal domain-containing protein [Nocardioides donggukensis]MBD8869592.1 PLDc N-terminal domain-containing protein [Nocardioides donggukensis]
MPASIKQWSDLSPGQQKVVAVIGVAEALATTAALWDLARRPRSEVRGPKWLWALGVTVQPVGPLAYFAGGRRTS